MIFLTKQEIEYKLEDLPFFKELKFDTTVDAFIYEKNGELRTIFPVEREETHRAIDQIIMTGHYLYSVNREFREDYLKVYDGKEFNINYRTFQEGRLIFFKDLFHLFLFGIVVPSYIKDLPEKPIHYFARPIKDEPNPSLQKFLNEEKKINNKYRRMDGTPFYNYIMKKSFIMPSNGIIGGNLNICPIARIVPEIKSIAVNLNEMAVYVFKKLLDCGTKDDKEFCKTFIDTSWSPYLKAN